MEKSLSQPYELEPNPEGRIGNWMETFTGETFWPLDPREAEINLTDIAVALSNQCRFAGHVDSFYSVAQHSVIVSNLLPPSLRMTGLLHDASEAYLVDIPRPIKPFLIGYAEMEEKVMRCIASKYGIAWPMPKEVKHADNLALAIEKRCFKKMSTHTWDVEELDVTKSIEIVPMLPAEASQYFLNQFYKLTNG